MINVTKSYLPPLTRYIKYLNRIWSTGQVTNHGPLVLELEEKLKKYLGVRHLYFVSNGTVALQLAIRALNIKREVLTTPFSYVASTSSIVWEGCTPKFVDINTRTLCIDVKKIEQAITRRTEAILAVHIYGNPCNVTAINAIAKKYKLRVLYDAAHAFGVRFERRSVLTFGDISTLSFHATKLFHTGEGGAVVTEDDELAHRLSYLRNFGHDGPEKFFGLGINGKNSELHAAMGLCILPKVNSLISKRRTIHELYTRLLRNSSVAMPAIHASATYNYAYYPVIFPSEECLLRVRSHLNEHQVFPRRYFYPSLNSLNYVTRRETPIAEAVSRKVLCLPLYHSLSLKAVRTICALIMEKL